MPDKTMIDKSFLQFADRTEVVSVMLNDIVRLIFYHSSTTALRYNMDLSRVVIEPGRLQT